MVFDWDTSLAESLGRRVEIRRQKWQIKKREAELEANRNFLKPRLDVVGRYRWRGFGHDLYPNDGDTDATTDMFDGKYQEWQAGLEFTMPIGFRQAFAAVRNSEMKLAREQYLLREQERAVVFDLSNSISEVDRAYTIVETNMNRRIAATEQVTAVQTAYDADNATLDSLLDAHRRQAEADVAYYRALVEYQLAVKNLQLEKGTLLEYCQIFLSEGAWPSQAYDDAEFRESMRGDTHTQIPVGGDETPWVSRGAVR